MYFPHNPATIELCGMIYKLDIITLKNTKIKKGGLRKKHDCLKIVVGSKNKIKIEAVKEILEDYSHLSCAQIVEMDVASEISDQPKSLEETVRGAMNRAKNVFKDCKYSFGLESGLMEVPNTKSGFMDVCVCAIYDGNEFHLGLSSAWEAPGVVTEYMINEGLNMSEAALKAGYSNNSNLGAAEGLVGVMTNGRLTRKEYTKQSIITALIHLEK